MSWIYTYVYTESNEFVYAENGDYVITDIQPTPPVVGDGISLTEIDKFVRIPFVLTFNIVGIKAFVFDKIYNIFGIISRTISVLFNILCSLIKTEKINIQAISSVLKEECFNTSIKGYKNYTINLYNNILGFKNFIGIKVKKNLINYNIKGERNLDIKKIIIALSNIDIE